QPVIVRVAPVAAIVTSVAVLRGGDLSALEPCQYGVTAAAADDLTAGKGLRELAVGDPRWRIHVHIRVDADGVPHVIDHGPLSLVAGADLDQNLQRFAGRVAQQAVRPAPPAALCERGTGEGGGGRTGVRESVFERRIERIVRRQDGVGGMLGY